MINSRAHNNVLTTCQAEDDHKAIADHFNNNRFRKEAQPYTPYNAAAWQSYRKHSNVASRVDEILARLKAQNCN